MASNDDEHVDDDLITSETQPIRRMNARVASECRVKYESVDELVVAYTEDISRGGLYVKTTKFLPIGAVVRVLLALPDTETELSVLARVAFIMDERQAEQHDREPGMGMGFLDVGGAPVADQIARYLADVSPEEVIPPSPAGMSSRVLIVDDDAYHRNHAADVMEGAGHTVFMAEDGLDGLRQAMEHEPDLILSDVQMPKLDGWQFVRMLRARPTLAQTPVVFVTSLGSDEQRLQGYRLGVDDYIAKPFDDDELALRTQRVLSRSRAYPRATASKTLRGDLAHVSLASLLGFLGMEARTGQLLLVRRDSIATLYLRDGNVVHIDLPSELANLHGAERLYAVLDWHEGRFELADSAVDDGDSIGVSTTAAILEHARRSDEAGAGADDEDEDT